MSRKRIIIHNADGISDEIVGAIMGLGLPESDVVSYRTREGQVNVAVIEGRKSRVYQIWKPYAEDILLNVFKPLE